MLPSQTFVVVNVVLIPVILLIQFIPSILGNPLTLKINLLT